MASCTSCFLSRSSDRRSQHFCDVCKYMFRMDQANGHNNWCSNHVFKVYAFCHHCSSVYEVPHRLGSTMLCLSNSSLSNTIHQSRVHHHPTAVNNKQDIQEAIAIKWMNQYKWPTYYSSHYCIDAMKQYRCVAKILITLYCNMANRSWFARYCCIIIRMTVDDWCCLFAFNVLII